ncbi:hypothetical protein METUNv1_01075 [Methyloversatilis universalis FAM5]|uniref:Uncharacterized protein n=1 Tax=Methyloversatilis universalis (strain ATCC BAA-1314 / DSM 25237 / JCM 13912 / CCUG 52030 / FAM5) TaxID=1000565 RepID=F5R9Z8_METUF|nr:hypothetical protein METUNv1_01075 [Methyloversatilis universalis FAM5]
MDGVLKAEANIAVSLAVQAI